MLRRFSVNYAIFSALMDAAAVLGMLHLSGILRPLFNPVGWFAFIPEPIAIPPALSVLFPVCWIGILASLSIYDGRRFVKAADEFTALSLASVLAGVALAGILYLSFREISRAQFIIFVILAYSALLAWRIAARAFFRVVGQHAPQAIRRIVVVGSGPLGRMVRSRLQEADNLGLSLVGFVDDAAAEGFDAVLLGRITDLGMLVDATAATDIIVALPPHFYDQIRAAVSCLSDKAVRIWIALGFYDLALYRTVSEDLAGMPMLDLRASALDDYERAVKRLFDIAFGLILLLLVSPLLVAASIAVFLGDGDPVLFRQRRVGENGRLFEMLKLRTMVRNAEELRPLNESRDADAQVVHKSRGDPRVTRVGRLLRRFSIDELPQLINVLRGDMSLVGPRPELPHLVAQYEPWQRQRLAVPPGITGWWQVTGRSDKVMHLHTEDDMYYVRNYSIWLDMQILLRTLWVVLLGRGAY
jgi:exopolysaccharide biosynthesis polyprenyl glycosylphosphotransferase